MLERFWIFAQETTAALRCLIADRRRVAPAPHAMTPPVEPAPLTLEERWVRATGAVTAAISGFGRIETLQTAAASQIDAADYTFQHLLKELSFAIPMPADGSALRALLVTVAEREASEEKILAA